MIIITDKSKCCGCTACANVCPKQCIKMVPDYEGFLYPEVDNSRCVNCESCNQICPILGEAKISPILPVSFAVQNRNIETLLASTSGGFFEVLCKYTILKGGCAVGVAFDENFKVVHKIANTLDEAQAFMGSKYVQSDLSDIFSIVKKMLNEGKFMTFSGTPCQVVGLKSYLQSDYENLITVDLICRSIPSPKFWMKYLDFQRKQYHSEIKSVQCRNKTYGYHNGSLVIQFADGRKYSGSNRVDLYAKSFHQDVCSRLSCYACKFKTISRWSDFTISDCWHPEELVDGLGDNNKGYTNVFIHSRKGIELFNTKLKDSFESHQTKLSKALKFTGEMAEKSIKKPKKRENFYRLLDELPFDAAVHKFVKVSVKDKVIEKIKSVLNKTGILKFKRH